MTKLLEIHPGCWRWRWRCGHYRHSDKRCLRQAGEESMSMGKQPLEQVHSRKLEQKPNNQKYMSTIEFKYYFSAWTTGLASNPGDFFCRSNLFYILFLPWWDGKDFIRATREFLANELKLGLHSVTQIPAASSVQLAQDHFFTDS